MSIEQNQRSSLAAGDSADRVSDFTLENHTEMPRVKIGSPFQWPDVSTVLSGQLELELQAPTRPTGDSP